MVKVCCELSKAHVEALERLFDALDSDVIRGCAESDQEFYDMLYGLERLREELKKSVPKRD